MSLGELLLESGLKMVRQQKKIKKLKAKVALLEERLRQSQQQQPTSKDDLPS
jgi:uncharacterized coiled-coil protein SlyX